jgi:outer membrane protein with beta-barrel domain
MNLRWFTLLPLLVLALPVSLLAQGEAGIKGGVSFGDISNKGLLPGNLDNRTGFAAGLYVGYRTGILGFDIEGLYAQRGAESDSVTANAPSKLDYIDVPVYAKILIPIELIQPYIYAGPQVSFEVRCRTANGQECPAGHEKHDYGMVFGAGIGFGGLGLEGRYVYGLKDLNLSTITSAESYETRSFLILLRIGRT